MNQEGTVQLNEQLNQLKLFKCEDIMLGDFFHYSLEEEVGKKRGIKSIINIIVRIACSSSYSFEVSGKPKTVALFSNSYRGRADHLKAFNNVSNLLTNSVQMICSDYKVDLSGIKCLYLPIRWNRQLRKYIPRISQRIFLLSILFQAYMDYQYLEKQICINNWRIDNLITYCDVLPVDCYFTQKFKQMGKTTVTLQHGTFNTESNGWAYLGSKSDYFLSESPSTVEAAQSIGYKGNIIAVGSPHYIGQKEYSMPEVFKTEVIGVVMNSSMLPAEDNIEMLRFMQAFCKKNKKKLILKYHPSNDIEFYSKLIDREVTTSYGKEVTIEQFGEMIDIAIVSASTVFCTMLRQWVPVFLYIREGHDPKLFSNVEHLKFHDETKLNQLLCDVGRMDFIKELERQREYFLASIPYEKNYILAFKHIETKKW